MQNIEALNSSLEETDQKINEMIEELVERTEYLCTGEACAGHANLI